MLRRSVPGVPSSELGTFLVGGDCPATSNPVAWARWPRRAVVRGTGSRAAIGRARQGRVLRPAHTLPDTLSTTAAGSNPTALASPAATTAAPTTGHSTTLANPHSSCGRLLVHAMFAPRR